MATFDFTDFYIKYKGHPKFRNNELIEDEIVKVIVQKLEMILFTDKGEVLGDPNFGADLNVLLHDTLVSGRYVETEIREQISLYVPELNLIDYKLEVSFRKNPNEHTDIMIIDIQIKEYVVNVLFT